MTRGITETDVWSASDALLLAGARPTIERVRLKIGRGSPNTVSPYLDSWFKHLGGRIKNPGAFSAPPELPDPVQQAAKHLWEVALAETRHDFELRLQDGLSAAVANVEAEKERADLAQAAAFEAANKAAHRQAELAQLLGQLEQERLARAAAEAHLDDAMRQVVDLQARLGRAEAELADLRAAAKQEVDGATERASAAELRGALEIDAQRVARARAERRADVLEQKLEVAHAEAREALAQHMQSTMVLKSDAERLNRELTAATSAYQEAVTEIRQLKDLVSAAQRAQERAKGEAAAARSALVQFEGLIVRPRLPKKLTKPAG